MQVVERIVDYAKDKGIKQVYICTQLGVARNWFSIVKRDNIKISPERLTQIADILGTTVEYLNGETDDPAVPEKEKSPSNMDGLTEFQSTILRLLDCVPEDRQDELASLVESALKMSGLLK